MSSKIETLIRTDSPNRPLQKKNKKCRKPNLHRWKKNPNSEHSVTMSSQGSPRSAQYTKQEEKEGKRPEEVEMQREEAEEKERKTQEQEEGKEEEEEEEEGIGGRLLG